LLRTRAGGAGGLFKGSEFVGFGIVGLAVEIVIESFAIGAPGKLKRVIADADRKVATLYGMIHPNASDTLTVRSVFVIGPDKRVKLMLTYPSDTGRDFDELLRVIDSLQLTARHQLATPANWRPGDECLIRTSVTDAQAQKLFPHGYEQINPYLRTTPQPVG